MRADIGQIEQLLLNLVINARDAIAGNGEIEITSENVSLRPEDINAARSRPPNLFLCRFAIPAPAFLRN